MRDEWFIRGSVPMTKSEVRAVSVEKLELSAGSVLYDIGAGTGSVSVEAAERVTEGVIYAVEKKPEAVRLLLKNRDKFHRAQIRVVKGEAPGVLRGLKTPTHAFLGGTSGKMGDILSLLLTMNPEVRVVVNAITVESVTAVMEWTKVRGIEAEIVQVSVSRAQAAGKVHMMMAQNPVFVISFGGSGSYLWKKEFGDWVGIETRVAPETRAKNKGNAYPCLMLAAPKSGSGKTMMACGLLAALKKRGLECRAFKCGPDYIDPMFHKYVLGIDGGNLDTFFLSEEQVKEQFKELAAGADISLVEGVMGYYDGVGGSGTWASSYEIAGVLDTPVILIPDCRGASLSLAAEMKGFLEYRADSRIKGVILNRISSVMAKRITPEIEKLGIPVLGYLPDCEAAQITSRHLGLILPQEANKLKERLEVLAEELEKTVDVDGILRLANAAGKTEGEPYRCSAGGPCHSTEPVRIAIARDETFCFYYQENIELFERLGAEFFAFDPMRDEHLPQGIAGLVLGGGYPELYAKELSLNKKLLKEVREAAVRGLPILAECGGFLYLHEELETKEGNIYPMAGVIAGRGFPAGKLSRFGYITIMPYEDNPLLKKGEVIRGHEFHYWDSTACGKAMKAVKPDGKRAWDCIHQKDGLLAGFPHMYYPSNPSVAGRWLSLCRKGMRSWQKS